jgi:hypothetical protein
VAVPVSKFSGGRGIDTGIIFGKILYRYIDPCIFLLYLNLIRWYRYLFRHLKWILVTCITTFTSCSFWWILTSVYSPVSIEIFCITRICKFIAYRHNAIWKILFSKLFYWKWSFLRSAVWKVRRKVCHLRLVCTALHSGQNLWRVQLWILSGECFECNWYASCQVSAVSAIMHPIRWLQWVQPWMDPILWAKGVQLWILLSDYRYLECNHGSYHVNIASATMDPIRWVQWISNSISNCNELPGTVFF